MLIENIQSILQRRKMNLLQLSKQCGVPYSTLKTMSYASDNCRVSTLVTIADFFGVSLDYLVKGVDGGDAHEIAVIDAYRSQPDMQAAVDRILCVPPRGEEQQAAAPVTAGNDLNKTLDALTVNGVKI